MAATAVKTGPIDGEKMNFRTQLVNGKPQIYFDAIDESTTKTRPKRNSRANNQTMASRVNEQKMKSTMQKSPPQNETKSNGNKLTGTKTNKLHANEDGSSLGVYMTMDELSELVKAVKENNKTQNGSTATNVTETKERTPPPSSQQQPNETNVVPKLELPQQAPPPPPPAQISPRQEALSLMAEKKRQKWMREKAEMDRMKLEVEYDQLKHQLSPHHEKAASSPERPKYPYDVASKPPPAPPIPMSLNHQHDIPPQSNDMRSEAIKTQLMERKQQQWKQENSEKTPVWNPFGRPGAGAPARNDNQMPSTQQTSNVVMPYRPPIPSQQQQQQQQSNSSPFPSNLMLNDQTRVPAAMRTNLLFGDVRFDDDVKTAKEIERRQWLDDLQKQIEDNKRHRFTQQETERRQDFLHENLQPLMHEAANRQQQQQKDVPPPPPQSTTLTTTSNSGQDLNKLNRHETVVQQTYDKILEATELAKYEKRAQLIEKLKRNGHKTDLIARTLPDIKPPPPTASNQKTGEKLFGPSYETSSKQNRDGKVEPMHLNIGTEQQQPYRRSDARKDEAVNTVDSTFRSDHSAQTDLRMPPHKQMFAYSREESDLPPQVPQHLLHHRHGQMQQHGKKNVRIRSLDDASRQRRTSTTTYHSNNNDDGATSQLGSQRSGYGGVDLLHRPLWNYQNPAHHEYVPNSKRDPNYEKRQRLKHFEQGDFERIDDVQPKTCYNRWNSDSELQQQRKKSTAIAAPSAATNRTRSTILKSNSNGHHRDESIMNLLKGQAKYQQEAFISSKPPPTAMKTTTTTDDESNYGNVSSFDKYESYVPYTRTDEVLDPAKAYSPVPESRDTSAHKGVATQDRQQREWDNANRQNVAPPPPPPYHVPPSRQEHILQQLSAIKENLVRRQQELASSMNVIPV